MIRKKLKLSKKTKLNLRHAMSGRFRELNMKSTRYWFRKLRTIKLESISAKNNHHDTDSIR